MQVSAHKSHKTRTAYPRKLRFNSHRGASYINLKPLKKANKTIVRYVVAKPYKTIGVATLLTGVLIGVAYLSLKHFIK